LKFNGGTKMVQKSVKKYENSTIRNPTTIKLLAEQIKLASDAYISKQMDEKVFVKLYIILLNTMEENYFLLMEV